MTVIIRLFYLLFAAIGLLVLGHFCFVDKSPRFSDAWMVQLTLGSLFTIAGLGFFYVYSRQQRRASRSQALQKVHPSQPWLWRDDWRQGYAESGNVQQAPIYLVMGLLFTLFSLPFMGQIISYLQHDKWQALIILIFPLIGIGLLTAFVRERIRFRRFGVSRFEFTAPVALGSRLTGKVTMPGLALLNQPAMVTLNCMRVQGSNNANRGSVALPVWLDNCTTRGQPDSRGVALPVDIVVPYDLQPTSVTNINPRDYIVWVLKVTSHVAGVDFGSQYNIPVLRTEKSDPALTRSNLRQLKAETSRTDIPDHFKSFTTRQTSSGLQVSTRRGLGWVNAIAGILVSLILVSIFAFIAYHTVTVSAMTPILTGVIFVLFGSLPVFIFGASVVALFNKTTLTFAAQALHVRKSGLIFSSKKYAYSEIRSVDVETRGGSGNTSLFYMNLHLNLPGGNKKKRVLYCNQKEDIDWLATQLEERLPRSGTKRHQG